MRSVKGTNKKLLNRLFKERDQLAGQIDRAYMRGNISDFIALDDKYVRLGQLIEQVQSVSNNRHRSNFA